MSQLPSTLRSFEMIKKGKDGIEKVVPKFKYMSGVPYSYKFNGQTGQFTRGGNTPEDSEILLNERNQPTKSFSFQPIAFRIFRDHLFGRKEKDEVTPRIDSWVEFFFVDEFNRVCVIMFAGQTVLQEIPALVSKLYYQDDDKTLLDVVITATTEQITSKNNPTLKWWGIKFEAVDANPELVKTYAEFEAAYPVFNASTITQNVQMESGMGVYFSAMMSRLAQGQPAAGAMAPSNEPIDVAHEVVNEPANPATEQRGFERRGGMSPQQAAEESRRINEGLGNQSDDDLPF